MNQNNKGFINIVVGVIIVVVIGVVGYFALSKKSETPNINPGNQNQTSTIPATNTTTQATVPNDSANKDKLLYLATDVSTTGPTTYRIMSINTQNNQQKEIATSDKLRFGLVENGILYVKENKLMLQNYSGQLEVILNFQPYLLDNSSFGSLVISPSAQEVVFSINPYFSTKNRKTSIYYYNLIEKNGPILIKQYNNLSAAIDGFVPYLWDAVGQIYMIKMVAMDCGGGTVVIDKNGKTLSNNKIIDSPHDKNNQYFLIAETLPSSPINGFAAGMCEDGKGNGKISIYNVKDKSFNVVEEDVNKNFIPLAISQNGNLVAYQVQDISSFKKGSTAGSVKEAGYKFTNVKTNEKKLFQNLNDLLDFLKSDSLGDDIFFQVNQDLYWNGTRIFESKYTGNPIYVLGISNK